MRSRRTRTALCLPFVRLTLIITHSAGCHSWQTVGPTPAEYLQRHKVEAARISRRDGTVLELQNPRVADDSLTGQLPGSPPMSLPLTEVDSLAVRKTDTGRTLALIGGVWALGFVVCLAGACGTGLED
jgi:hypothetical protein